MPARKRRGPDREGWVPADVAPGSAAAPPEDDSARSGTGDPDTDEWLVPGAARSSKSRQPRRRRAQPSKPKSPKRAPARRTKAADDAELTDLKKRLAEAERRSEELRDQHETELEKLRAEHASEVERLREEHERELGALREKSAAAKKAPRPRPRAERAKYPKTPKRRAKPAVENGSRLDINTIDFEELRALGLSVTESARLIATRDAREGFESLKELDDLDDLPDDVVSTLKQRLRV